MIPMLAQTTATVPEGSEWIMEPKWDGWRCIAEIRADSVVLRTRSGQRITSLPYVESAVQAIFPPDSTVDGEIVDLSPAERAWNRTQRICSRNTAHVPNAQSPALTFVAFDLPRVAGEDLARSPLSARRNRLALLLRPAAETPGAVVRLCPQWSADQRTADALVAAGMEGVVAKRVDSPYVPDRSGYWLKYKPQSEIEATCIGTFRGDGGGVGLRFRLDSGFEGTVYSGISLAQQADIAADPGRYIGHIIEILHLGVLESGALLNPTLHRVRSRRDKAPVLRLVREQPRARKAPLSSTRRRNYVAMRDAKLTTVIHELRSRSGDAYARVTAKGESLTDHLNAAESAARARGLHI